MTCPPETRNGPILELRSVTRSFGGLVAVSALDLAVHPGSIYGLIGPNGAGKTTVFNVVTGAAPATEGTVLFGGRDVTRLQPYAICRLGIARTFQNVRLFPTVSVLENVRIAASWRAGYGWLHGLIQGTHFRRCEQGITERAWELLERFGLAERASEEARGLPYGEQRRLEIARALATLPRLLLLDEPAAGLNASETEELMELVRHIRDELDTTILLIEHDMRLVMGVCERITVLDHGEKISEGTPAEVRSDPCVVAAYLGEEAGLDAPSP